MYLRVLLQDSVTIYIGGFLNILYSEVVLTGILLLIPTVLSFQYIIIHLVQCCLDNGGLYNVSG